MAILSGMKEKADVPDGRPCFRHDHRDRGSRDGAIVRG